jgi:dihydropteroate synthase
MKFPFRYNFGKIQYDLSARTYIMGILNVTPDSFSDGGRFLDHEEAVKHGERLAVEGADFLDIGGESTRPGSETVTADEEIRRVVPVIEELSKRIKIPISVDTYKSKTADAALRAGAVIVNDISAMTFDKDMALVAAGHKASVVLMHIKGTPKTMQENPVYTDVTEEVKQFLRERIEASERAGIEQIFVDPGIGFGKRYEHNVQLIRDLGSLAELNYPVLAGLSRKSFIGTILNLPPGERLEGTSAAVAAAIANGANVVRVHDVREMKRVAMVSDALKLPGRGKIN